MLSLLQNVLLSIVLDSFLFLSSPLACLHDCLHDCLFVCMICLLVCMIVRLFASFLLAFLASFLASLLPCFLPSFLPSFLILYSQTLGGVMLGSCSKIEAKWTTWKVANICNAKMTESTSTTLSFIMCTPFLWRERDVKRCTLIHPLFNS